MTASAALLGALGLTASFLSHEMLAFMGATVETQSVLIIQVAGALYLGFAMLNWHTRGFVIGGIYARPLAIGNFMHFAVGAIPLGKVALATSSPVLGFIAIAYTVLGMSFAVLLFGRSQALPDKN